MATLTQNGSSSAAVVDIPVNAEVLTWARVHRGLSKEVACERLKWSLSDLEALEAGTRTPNLGQLERLSRKYQIPLATLLMPTPLPDVRPSLVDFRSFDGRLGALSHETMIAVEQANLLIDGISELREELPGFIPNSTAAQYSIFDDPVDVAHAERAKLGISPAKQFGWKTAREAFLNWREAVEDQGVFAYQLKLGEDDTRGLAIIDERNVPAIILDASDTEQYPAKTFTVMHEYAHVLLRMGGISNQNRSNSVERYCNVFAAHLLMPQPDFEARARVINPADAEWNDVRIGRLAEAFKTSKSSVALHLEELDLAPKGLYQNLRRLWSLNVKPKTGGRATYQEQMANRLGTRHIRLMFGAVEQGLFSKLSAYESTFVKPKHYQSIVAEAMQRRAAYGRPG